MSAREREVRACGRTLPHLKHLTLQGRIAYQCPGIQMASESTTPLSEQQLAEIRAQIGDARPATNGLLESFGKSIADRVGHDHTTQREDWFCLNLAAYMGEKAAPVLRRLLDAESRAERYRIAWRMARTRAVSVGGAADRAGARVRELLPALQEAVFATIAMQMERDAARDEAARLRLALKSARRGRAVARTRTAVLEAERHSTNEALDDAVKALAEKGRADAMVCAQCETPVGYIDCPTGGWWAHEKHPSDEHDADPKPATAVETGEPA